MWRDVAGCVLSMVVLANVSARAATLQLCAPVSKTDPTQVLPNAGVKVRTQCKVAKGGTPKEISILNTDQVAQIGTLQTSVSSQSTQISALQASNSSQSTQISALQAATTPTGTGTFQSTNPSGSFAVDNFGEGVPGTVLMATVTANGDLGPQLRFVRQPSGNFVDIGQLGDGTFTIEPNDGPVLTVAPDLVGVGIQSGTAQLKINGVGFNNVTAYVKAGASDQLAFQIDASDGTTMLQVATDGTLFLNEGNAFKQGGGSWGAISDARLKTNVQDLHGALEQFQALRAVTFEFIDPAAIGERPGTHVGFTAQQVEGVFPDWVGERADGVKYVAPKGFEALTVAAVTELRHEKDEQMARLTAENRDLRDRLVRLEAAVARLTPAATSCAANERKPRATRLSRRHDGERRRPG